MVALSIVPPEHIEPRTERFRTLTLRSLLTDAKHIVLFRITPARAWRSYRPATDGVSYTVIRAKDRPQGGHDETPDH